MAGVGKPGPLPKDPEQRLRRNKTGEDGLPYDFFDIEGEVEIPTAYFMNTYVNEIWLALKTSVHRKFYEPVDWAYAKMALMIIDKQLGEAQNDKVPGPTMLMTLDGMMSKMMITPADRRRLKIEAQRGSSGKDGKVISAQDVFRQRFDAQRKAQ